VESSFTEELFLSYISSLHNIERSFLLADYKMYNNEFRDRSGRTIARIYNNELRDSGNRTIVRIYSNELRDASNRTLAKVVGEEVRDSSNRIMAKLPDIRKKIDGAMGGTSIAAFWIAFLK
jgi:hypothetical protein